MYHAHHCSPGNASGWGHHLDALLYFRNLPSEPRSCNSHRCPASSFRSPLHPVRFHSVYLEVFQPPFLCGSLLLHRDPVLSGTFLFHRKKCRFFGFLFRPSHWLYARRQPDPGLYDPAFFQKAGKCIHCIRRFKLLYLHRKCDFHLWHCRPFRPDWLELHSSDLGSLDICRHSHLHSMRPALAKKILVKNYGKIPRPCVY